MNFSLRCCRLLLRMWWAVSRLMTAPSILCVCEWESVWSDSSAHTHTAARCVVSCINRAWKWSFPWESLWCIVGLTGSTRSRGVRRGGACGFSSLSQNITGVLIETSTHQFLNTWGCHCWVHLWCQTMWLFIPTASVCVCVWTLADRQKCGPLTKRLDWLENVLMKERASQSDRENQVWVREGGEGWMERRGIERESERRASPRQEDYMETVKRTVNICCRWWNKCDSSTQPGWLFTLRAHLRSYTHSEARDS